MSRKTLTVFFSMKGETLEGREIVCRTKGHAQLAAEYIHEAVSGDLFEIETEVPYPENHMQRVMQARRELAETARPALLSLPELFEDYDMVFLCFPIWWFTIPMPVASFLEQLDWSGKTVIPINTSNSSGTGYSTDDIRSFCRTADVRDGIALKGQTVEKFRNDIARWALKQAEGSD